MYIASIDIKTAFDVARPRHLAEIIGNQDDHGWITAALLQEMKRHEGHAAFESVESRFHLTRCIRQGSVEAPTLWLRVVKQILVECGEKNGR